MKLFLIYLNYKTYNWLKRHFNDTNQNVTNCLYYIQVLNLKKCWDKIK